MGDFMLDAAFIAQALLNPLEN
jgi:hypothetical protein